MTSTSTRAAALATLCSALAALAAVWCVPFVFSGDGPEHLYSASLLAGGARTLPLAAGGLLEVHWPVTSVGYLAPAVPLGRLLGPVGAHAALLGLIVVLHAAGGWSLARRLGGGLWATPVLAAASLNYLFWMGFLNFLIAQGAALLLLAWAAGVDRWTPARGFLLSCALLLVGWLHVLGGLLAGLVLLACVLATPGGAGRWRGVLGLGLASVPLLALQGLVTMGASTIDVADSAVPAWHWSHIGALVLGGPAWRWAPAMLLAVVGALTTLGSTAQPRTRAVAGVGLALMPLGLVLPYSLPGWEVFGPRFSLFGMLLALSAAGTLERAMWRSALLAAALGTGIAASAWAGSLHQRAFAGCADLWNPAGRAPVGPSLQFFAAARSCIDPARSEDTPLLPGVSFTGHAGALVATQRGAVHMGFQGVRVVHGYTVQPPARFDGRTPVPTHWTQLARGFAAAANRPDPALRAAAAENAADAAATAATADSLVLFGDIEAFAPVLAYGFREEYRAGDLLVASFADRPAPERTLRIEGAPAGLGTVLVEYGWVPLGAPLVAAPVALRDGAADVLLPRVPAAPFWVRVTTTADAAAWRCLGANEDNLLVFHFAAGSHPLRCQLQAGIAP